MDNQTTCKNIYIQCTSSQDRPDLKYNLVVVIFHSIISTKFQQKLFFLFHKSILKHNLILTNLNTTKYQIMTVFTSNVFSITILACDYLQLVHCPLHNLLKIIYASKNLLISQSHKTSIRKMQAERSFTTSLSLQRMYSSFHSVALCQQCATHSCQRATAIKIVFIILLLFSNILSWSVCVTTDSRATVSIQLFNHGPASQPSTLIP